MRFPMSISGSVCQSLCALSFLAAMAGCGSTTTTACKLTAINVSPQSSTLNHNAPAPGNAQLFNAFATATSPGCVVPASNLTTATWSVSDTTNISISNVHDNTYGTATCHGATAGAATVTATVPAGDGTNVSGTASLTCN